MSKDHKKTSRGTAAAAKNKKKKKQSIGKMIALACLRSIPGLVIEAIAIFIGITCELDDGGRLMVALTHLAGLLALLLGIFKPRLPNFLRWIPFAAVPYGTFLLLEWLTHNPFEMSSDIVFLNVLLFAAVNLTLMLVLGRTAPAVIVTCLTPMLLGCISYFTSEFRGTPLLPWDLASYGIAATVLGEYNIEFTPKLGLIAACTILICVVAVVWNVRFKFKFSKYIRPVLAVAMCIVTIGIGSYVQTDECISEFGLYPYLFTPDYLYKTNGFAVSFTMNLRYTSVEKPDGYSEDSVDAIADEYESDSAAEAEKLPNIIVIMNESFADMTYLADFTTSEDIMPYINSMEENTIKGTLYTSVVGGNTPNSEFEFLTGMTMGFLPTGSIPYQQFIRSERLSVASQMKDLGYTTVAMHPYWAEGWKREQLYPLLGFDEMYFLDDSFKSAERLRGYVSDKGLYATIIEQFESDMSDSPRFVFAVTMQNHGGYGTAYNNFTPEIMVSGLENSYAVSNYMSLVRESDRAFEYLVEYFKNYDEPTIILMFGDHQPNDSIANPLLRMNGITIDTSDVESSINRYKVPYIITANFELNGDAPEELSLNYLSTVLTDLADLPQTAVQKYMSEMLEEYPVITAICTIDKSRNVTPISEYETSEILKKYSHIQYGYLFDYSDTPKELFSLK